MESINNLTIDRAQKPAVPVVISNMKRISPGGVYSTNGVFSAQAEISSAKEPGRKRQFPVVIKPVTKDDHAGSLIAKHQKLKSLGLPVVTTFGVDLKENVVFMTDLNIQESVALSANNDSDLVPAQSINEFQNLERAIYKMLRCVVKMSEASVQARFDTYFFHTNISDDAVATLTGFSLGDLDTVNEFDESEFPRLLGENYKCLKQAFYSFVDKYARNKYIAEKAKSMFMRVKQKEMKNIADDYKHGKYVEEDSLTSFLIVN